MVPFLATPFPTHAGLTMQKASLGGKRVSQRAGAARAARGRVVSCSASKVKKVVLAYSGGECCLRAYQL